jgi:hypothetical protein
MSEKICLVSFWRQNQATDLVDSPITEPKLNFVYKRKQRKIGRYKQNAWWVKEMKEVKKNR